MADNVAITAGTGTTIATDDIGGAQYQRIKIGLGADGSATDAVGGAGAVSSAVQRVTLASDDPAVVDLAAIEILIGTTNTTLSTIDGRVDGVEGLLTTIDADTGAMVTDLAAIEVLLTQIDADTGNIVTAVQLIDNAISGSEMQVDVVAALPAGSNTIGAVTNTHLTNALIGEYETVAASQTTQTIGPTGATGDYLAGVLVVPATTSPGNVLIKDGGNSAITVFTGGASSVTNLVPFMIPLGLTSTAGAWQVTTGANVSCVAIGNFT